MTEQRKNVILIAVAILCAEPVEPLVNGEDTGVDFLR
jgi:hypothetical protein